MDLSGQTSLELTNILKFMCKIEFSIEKQTYVIVKVVDITGNLVSMLLKEHRAPGNYQVDFHDENLTPGNYYFKIYVSENYPVNGELTSADLVKSGKVSIGMGFNG